MSVIIHEETSEVVLVRHILAKDSERVMRLMRKCFWGEVKSIARFNVPLVDPLARGLKPRAQA